MEPADSSSTPRDTEKKNTMPSSAGESDTWFEDFKRKTMNLKVEESFCKIAEITSDILVFSRQMDEYEKAIDLKEKLFMERYNDLKKKEEVVKEREMDVELAEREVEVNRNFLELKEKELEREIEVKRNVMEVKEKELEEREKKVELREGEVEVKENFMELKEKELEEREKKVELRERQVEEGSRQKGLDAESLIFPGTKQKSITDFSGVQTSEPKRTEIVEISSTDDDDEPFNCPDPEMSHITGGKTVTIFPRKGETWALYRDWNKTWNRNLDQHTPPYNYDFVEVVSEFNSDLGVGVAYLGKVEGFTSVYKRDVQHGVLQMLIPYDEMVRFSHKVPSLKMNGDEKEGVPAGSFELDSAAIPQAYLKAAKVEEEQIMI